MADSFWSSTPMDMLAFGQNFLETSVIIKGLSFLPFPEARLQVDRSHASKAPRSASRPRTVVSLRTVPVVTLRVSPVASGAIVGSGMDRGPGIKLGAPVASLACSPSLISHLRDEDTATREKWRGPRRQGAFSQLTCYYVRKDLRLFQNR